MKKLKQILCAIEVGQIEDAKSMLLELIYEVEEV